MSTDAISWIPACLPPDDFVVAELVSQTGERDFGVWTGSNWSVGGEVVQPVAWRGAAGMFRVAERVTAENLCGGAAQPRLAS